MGFIITILVVVYIFVSACVGYLINEMDIFSETFSMISGFVLTPIIALVIYNFIDNFSKKRKIEEEKRVEEQEKEAKERLRVTSEYGNILSAVRKCVRPIVEEGMKESLPASVKEEVIIIGIRVTGFVRISYHISTKMYDYRGVTAYDFDQARIEVTREQQRLIEKSLYEDVKSELEQIKEIKSEIDNLPNTDDARYSGLIIRVRIPNSKYIESKKLEF